MAELIIIGAIVAVIYFVVRGRGGGRSADRPTSASQSSRVRLSGEGEFDFDIVGESRHQHALETICGGRTDESADHDCEAMLIPEPWNAYDRNAVRVEIDGRKVGYFAREDAAAYQQDMAALGLSGRMAICDALIVGGWDRGARGQGHFGVKLDLTWPIEPEKSGHEAPVPAVPPSRPRLGCGAIALMALGLMFALAVLGSMRSALEDTRPAATPSKVETTPGRIRVRTTAPPQRSGPRRDWNRAAKIRELEDRFVECDIFGARDRAACRAEFQGRIDRLREISEQFRESGRSP